MQRKGELQNREELQKSDWLQKEGLHRKELQKREELQRLFVRREVNDRKVNLLEGGGSRVPTPGSHPETLFNEPR